MRSTIGAGNYGGLKSGSVLRYDRTKYNKTALAIFSSNIGVFKCVFGNMFYLFKRFCAYGLLVIGRRACIYNYFYEVIWTIIIL